MWALYFFGGTLLLIVLLLAPRVYLRCAWNDRVEFISLHSVWLGIRWNSVKSEYIFRFLFIKLVKRESEISTVTFKKSKPSSTQAKNSAPSNSNRPQKSATTSKEQSSAKSQPSGKSTKPKRVKQAKAKRKDNFSFDDLPLVFSLLKKLFGLIVKMISISRVDWLRSKIVVGNESPAVTGMVYGLLTSVTVHFRKPIEIETYADFENQEWNTSGSVSLSISPLMALVVLVVWILKLPLKEIYHLFKRQRLSAKSA